MITAVRRMWLATLTSAALTLGVDAAAPQSSPVLAELPAVRWQLTLRSATSEYELKAAAPAGDGLWLVIGVRPRGELGGPQVTQMLRLNARGETERTIDLASLIAGDAALSEPPKFVALASLPTGEALVLLGAPGKLVFVRVNPNGTAALARSTTLANPNSLVTAMRRIDGGVIAIGRSGSSGWILKLSATGDVVSDVTIADPGVQVLNDAIPLTSGYLVAGSSSRDGRKIWLGRIDASGAVVKSQSLPGTTPSLVSDVQAGRFVLTYVAEGLAPSATVQRFSDALVLEPQPLAAQIVRSSRPFDVQPVASGQLLIVGEGTTNLPTLCRANRDGAIVWTFQYRAADAMATRLWNAQLEPWGGDVIAALTLTVVEPKGDTFEQRQVIRLIRLGSA
jgi:hypothetical protein